MIKKRDNAMGEEARVQKLMKKTRKLEAAENKPGSILSENKVTGWSLNFPIKGTCQPSKLCIETCYFATGMTAWTNSLRKQLWNYESCVEDPIAFAKEVIKEYDKKIKGKSDFLRWNGGGDLFPEAVEALNWIGEHRPDLVIWVVTRKPTTAALLGNWPNIYLHFSLDKHSLDRQQKVMDMLDDDMKERIFFSYQTESGEIPDMYELMDRGVALFFFDNYKVPPLFFAELRAQMADYLTRWDALCPLNTRRSSGKSIEGTCNECRMCFDGRWEDVLYTDNGKRFGY